MVTSSAVVGSSAISRLGPQTSAIAIIACDATADPGAAFADLQYLLSLAEADFGVKITFKPPPLDDVMPTQSGSHYPLDARFAKSPFVQGEIRYPDGTVGKLYYVKPSIFDGLRLNVLGFKGSAPHFPNDSTVNQFFDEARFEAYRELGFSCVEAMLADPGRNAQGHTIKEKLLAV